MRTHYDTVSFTGALPVTLPPEASITALARSLLPITEDNVADLRAEDFKAFSFFSTEKTTIGLVHNGCGATFCTADLFASVLLAFVFATYLVISFSLCFFLLC